MVAEGFVFEDAADGRQLDAPTNRRLGCRFCVADEVTGKLFALGTEDGGLLGLDELAEHAGDVGNVRVGQFLALAAEAFAHLLPEPGGVDELHLALARFGLAIAHDPHIGADAGVVEHVGGQADDGLTQVVFEHVTSDLTFARPRTAGEQRRAVEHDAEAAAAIFGGAHLGDEVQQKQHGAVTHARQAGAESAVISLLLVLFANLLLDLFPFHAKGRVGQHVIERLARVPVITQRVAEGDVGNILPLDDHVGLADGVRLGVEFLPKHGESGFGVVLGQIFAGDAEHAAGTRRGVVKGAHHAGPGQHVVILHEDEVDHEADHLARGEMLPGGLVADFGKLADQLLEHETHLVIADALGMQVDVGEFFHHAVKQTGSGQSFHLGVELETLEHVSHRRRKGLEVAVQVLANVVLIAHEGFHVQRRGVVEALPGNAKQERLRIQARSFSLRLLGQHGGLGRRQHAVETAQHRERQDDPTVLALLVIPAQQVSNRPDEGRQALLVHGAPFRSFSAMAGATDRHRTRNAGSLPQVRLMQ